MTAAHRFRAFAAALAVVAATVAASPVDTGGQTSFPRCRFVEGRFVQPEPLTIDFWDSVKRAFTSRRGPWPDFTPMPPGPPPPRRVEGGDLRVTFVNHSTFLIQVDGLNVLTDPTWAGRSVEVVGVHRRRPPGLRLEDLPPIDAVLISHDHQDHMDLPTLRRLVAAWHPAIYCGLGNAAFLARHGVPGGIDLDWWQQADLAAGVTLTAVPARHHAGRGLFDGDRRLWCGFVLSGPSGEIYFAGDTGWGSHFASIAGRFPRIRLALLPIGGFKPVWYMHEHHLGPADAIRAQRVLGASTSVPMHFGTFPNGDEADGEAVETLRALLAADPGAVCGFEVLENGQALDVAPFHPARAAPGAAENLRWPNPSARR
ncbi:MAG TPA: MBL fold metallo-hydrolase [Thermoanaerobaculia bacterium]|nr:MBL fold metallo-hydrolase [Thermoanaerobaculia bacterium]